MKEEKIMTLTKNGTLMWKTKNSLSFELGRLEPFHRGALQEATAKLGEFDLEWKPYGLINVSYLGIPVTSVDVSKELEVEIEKNGKRSLEMLESKFLRVLEEADNVV
jgi:hypothetical protein